LAILDTHATARVHRRLGMTLFSQMLRDRFLPNLHGILSPPVGQRRWLYVLDRLRTVNARAAQYLHIRVPGPQAIKRHLQGTDPPAQEPFIQLLAQGYRPPRLPLTVHLYAPKMHLPALRRLWQFYAIAGVHSTPLFENHHDFYRPELATQLGRLWKTQASRAKIPVYA
jgi:hypothetical protein